MNDSAVAAAIDAHVRAFNDRDVDALMAGFTDDAVWITGTTVVRGRAALAELFAAAMADLLPTLTVQNLLVGRDRAVCQLVETLRVDGERRVCSVAGFYRLRDGRIASAKIYREGSAEVE
ncbi:nuclear transport factor 2 family protein [Kitasatospora griseola]|uniref:nuclear transport factor 2 family protein n=1 Tax=Kitasatospora griseola TaxID=2064 RepID=UPI0036603F21